jgi:hypothetical protein
MQSSKFVQVKMVDLLTKDVILSKSVRRETAAGMVAASLYCFPPSVQLRVDADIRNHLVAGYIHSDDVTDITDALTTKLDHRDYHWWIKSLPPTEPQVETADAGSYYSLYRFRTSYFVQGLLTVAHHCSVDFRQFAVAHGLPWKLSDDGGYIVYKLNGYDLTNSMDQVVVEDSIFDEVEEQFNENLLEPYGNVGD